MTESGDRLLNNGVSADGLTRLVDACLRISSELDPGAVLQKIADEARQVAQAQYSAVQVFETGTDPGELVTSGFTLKEGESTEHPVSLEPLLRPVSGSQEAPEAQDAGPWLTVQVSYDEEDVARLHVADRDGGEDFTPEDRTLLYLDFTQNPGKVMDDITFVRSHWWLVSEGFSLSTANSDVQKLPATLYHRIADSLAYAA